MKEEIVVNLIKTGALNREQVDALEYQYSYEVLSAIISSGLYSDDELVRMIQNNSHIGSFHLWEKIVKNSKEENLEMIWKILKIIAANNNRSCDFVDVVEMGFNFVVMEFPEVMSTLKKIVKIYPDSNSRLAEKLFKQRCLTKPQFFAIGSFMRNDDVWEDIIIRQIGYANLTKKEILSLMRKRSLTRDSYLELLKAKKVFSQKRIIKLLRKITKATSGTATRDNIINLLAVEYKYDARKFLKVARQVNTSSVWEAFQEKFRSADLLNKKDIKNILLKGDWSWRSFAINSLDIRTLRRLVNPKNSEKRDSYLVGAIIKSKRLSKKLSLKLARETDWYSVWGDLITSGHFSDDEVIALVKKEVRYHLDEVWRTLCSHIDLSKRSTEELLEFGNLAKSDEVWEKINAVLNKKQKSTT